MVRQVRDTLLERVRIRNSYRKVFSTPDGQVVLHHMMRTAKVTRPTFVAGDPHRTSFNEGQRHLALSILKFVVSSEEEFIKQVERGLETDDT